MKLTLEKTHYGLVGAIPADQASIDNLPLGTYTAEIRRPRNVQFHRKFFSLLNLAFDMQDEFKTLDTFLDALKIYSGHFDTVKIKLPPEPNEEELDCLLLKPRSISFSKMTEPDFEAFYSRCVDVLIQKFCPGKTPEEMDEAAKKYLQYV